jgi:3-deoxy-manno-octulosonate cytidylyltransferase (CMP-KDO synthetase)
MAKHDVLVLIPARMASSRLPGKPLADIAGQPMIVHVLRRAQAAALGQVVVATDSEEIAAAVAKAGGQALMTRGDHATGSDRVHEAAALIDPDRRASVVLNIQGDFPTLASGDVKAVLGPLSDPAVDIATLAGEILTDDERMSPNVVKARGGCGRSISPARPRPTARARSTITSGSTPSGAPPSTASSRCRPRRSSNRSGSNSCVRWRPACAST